MAQGDQSQGKDEDLELVRQILPLYCYPQTETLLKQVYAKVNLMGGSKPSISWVYVLACMYVRAKLIQPSQNVPATCFFAAYG